MKKLNNLFRVDQLFQSGMVLQREKEIKIWGNAPAGSNVTATIGNNSGTIIANSDYTFMITLPPMEAAENLVLVLTCDAPDTCPIELFSISIGDVWLACGQSNMEFFLKYDQDWEKVQKQPKNPHIHMYNTPQVAFEGHTTHSKTGYGYWFSDKDKGYEVFSAPAYSFAQNLQPSINIPIGLIGCNWGGSTASAWVPEEVLSTPPLDNYFREYEEAMEGLSPEEIRKQSIEGWAWEDSTQHYRDFEPLLYGRERAWQLNYMKEHAGEPVIPMGPYNLNRPSGLYHTMLSKLIPFPIKGVLWYQGESDAGNRAWMYDKLLSALITDWRKEWNDNFPFLLVQLAPFGKWLDCGNEEYTLVRQKQEIVCNTVDNTYLTSIMDLGSYYDIHPKAKMEVGRRLSLLARGHVYGEDNLLCDPPRYASGYRENNEIVIILNSSEGLHFTDDKDKTDIVLQINEQEYTPAAVAIANDNLVLTLPDEICDFHQEITVSVGWGDYSRIFISNKQGLSIAPFQTTL